MRIHLRVKLSKVENSKVIFISGNCNLETDCREITQSVKFTVKRSQCSLQCPLVNSTLESFHSQMYSHPNFIARIIDDTNN